MPLHHPRRKNYLHGNGHHRCHQYHRQNLKLEMLNLLAEGKSIESISQILSEKYGATIDLVASDVQIFVHSIEEKGLL